jgi:multidrug efflux pump subunit AcrA (membrane-fusion protein)
MAERADVRSSEAIAAFRSSLLLYISKVRPLLDDSIDEINRSIEWVKIGKRIEWESKVRQYRAELAEAQQALFSAEIAKLRRPSTAEIAAVQRAKRGLNEAEEKLRHLQKLSLSFEREALVRIKEVEKLRSVVAVDLREGAYYLERILQALDRYTLPAGLAEIGESAKQMEDKPNESGS